jgi:hypothetical protein
MPSGCARIPTSSIFITTSRPQLHFHLATSDQRIGVMRKLEHVPAQLNRWISQGPVDERVYRH